MKHIHYQKERAEEVTAEGARGIKMRNLIGEKDGAPNFCMRSFTFEPGGGSPSHEHPWEHEVFVLNGRGTVEIGDKTATLRPGDVVYVPPNVHHHFSTEQGLEFI